MSALHWGRTVATAVTSRLSQHYLSHQIGHLKPDRESFDFAVRGMGRPPSDILFIDDGPCNVRAAAEFGLRAELARGPEEARDRLSSDTPFFPASRAGRLS